MNGIRFSRFAAKAPDSRAIVDASGTCWTRGQIAELTNGLSRALREAGLRPGDVVAVVSPNSAEYLIAFMAATQIGLYVVPINIHLAPREASYILENCGARALLADERCKATVEPALDLMRAQPAVRICITGRMHGFVNLADAVQGMDTTVLDDSVEGRTLSYTSATTGYPKGVLLPLEAADAAQDLAIDRRIAAGTLPERHVLLCYSMLYHGSPLENAVTALHMGQVVVLARKFSPENLLQLIDRYEVTQAYIVPTMFARLLLLDEATRSRYSTKSLTRVLHGGAACPMEVKRRMIDWWGRIFWESYGATEGAGTIVASGEWLQYPGTVGRPIPGSQLKILGQDKQEVPTGTPGLVYMTRYTGEKFEYLGDPEKTRAVYRGDFFTVGDIGYVNDAGYLFLCDREIDMISLSGVKVYPAEIEGVYVQHPYVADCAVFGVPDETHGEAVVALIQLSSTAPVLKEASLELAKFLGQRISPYKLPKHVEFVDQLGREATGKLRKRLLREGYLERFTRRDTQ